MTDRLLIERDRRLPLAHFALSRVDGSLTDPPGKEGLTRLTLRLMRRTAGGRSADENNERLDLLGGSLVGDVSRCHMGISGVVLAENAEPYLSIMEQAWKAPGLFEDEFVRVKDESLAEWYEGLDSDRSLAFAAFERNVFGAHPLSRPPSGTPRSLQAISHAEVLEHAKKLGQSSNLLLAGAGDFTPGILERFAAGLDLDDRAATSPLPLEASAPLGRRLFFVDKPARTQSQIVLGGLGSHPEDSDQVALHVANTIFGGTFTARLSREIRVKRGWSYGAYSYLSLDRARGTFSVWTFPEAKDTLACVQLTIELLESLVERGVTRAELSRAQNYLRKSHVFSNDTAQKRAQLRLEEALYGLEPGYFASFPDRVSSVTVEDIQAALARRLSPENLTIAVVGTHSDIGRDLEANIPRLATASVLRYDDPD